MPEKRKTEQEHEADSSYAKRVRQQLSYADLDGHYHEVGVMGDNGMAPQVAREYESDGQESTETTERTKQEDKKNKRQQRNNTRPRVDPVFGQRSAFPGLDDIGSEELFYGPAEDGLEYLRMVRSEANSLPTLFVAAKATTTQKNDDRIINEEDGKSEMPSASSQVASKEGKNDDGFLLVDGVFIATSAPSRESAEEATLNVQSAYYNMLRHRFIYLRSTLKCSPPAAAIASLDETHPITFPYHVKGARLAWRRMILSSDPQMVQLACMDMLTVLNVLRLLGEMISECIKGGDIVQLRRIGAWAWGLLGKCRDVGELGSEEVGDIRVLGRRAVGALAKLNKVGSAASLNDTAESGPEDNEDSDGEDEEEISAQTTDDLGNGSRLEEEALEIQEAAAVADDPMEGIDDSQAIPTVEPMQTDEVETTENLEAAKARLQSRLLASAEPEEQESKSEIAERGRRNTSSPLDEGEVVEKHDDLEPEQHIENTPQSRDKQTRALLDMIITIVGEFYGQRDLLQQRDIWQ
ncbi:hypothetical protein BGW36DRAFT_430678 [Talaromyces proteolyticus]|uniref:Uncharacterized protein n=1 Tax=Talaromyces proteolyticus TaxID=1131652 RepID=A0AAD4KJV9_9EURO|nr:uncharacterized protein BGW36DRAFT_430678 [Talaromyces proteolyticus]KAH8692936.1 hypothetical protein BGW36DRAFT_430678 [Talaromyces proteolyticus]